MGREARAKTTSKVVRVKLDRGDYWELRAVSRDIEALRYDHLKLQRAKEQEIGKALARRTEVFDRIAKAHETMNGTLAYRFEDKTCTLITDGQQPDQVKARG